MRQLKPGAAMRLNFPQRSITPDSISFTHTTPQIPMLQLIPCACACGLAVSVWTRSERLGGSKVEVD